MRVQSIELERDEFAVIELARMQPVRYLPPMHLAIAKRLAAKGLLARMGRTWVPTRMGLALIGITIH